MSDKKSATIIWISAGVALALLAGTGVTWLVLGSKVRSLEKQVTELEASTESSASADASDLAGEADAPTGAQDSAADVPADAEPVEDAAGPTEVQPAYVLGIVSEDGAWKLQVDYIQFLTGDEAAQAATAHGDESPPPNGYYVVNDNPKIREFPVQAGIAAVVVTNDDGTSDPAGHALSLSQWGSALSGPHGPVFRSTIYWVTVTNGTVTAINAQYTP